MGRDNGRQQHPWRQITYYGLVLRFALWLPWRGGTCIHRRTEANAGVWFRSSTTQRSRRFSSALLCQTFVRDRVDLCKHPHGPWRGSSFLCFPRRLGVASLNAFGRGLGCSFNAKLDRGPGRFSTGRAIKVKKYETSSIQPNFVATSLATVWAFPFQIKINTVPYCRIEHSRH